MRTLTFDLTGRVAVVTGSTKGLGLSQARLLAAHNATVVINSRTEADCIRVAGELKDEGKTAMAFCADVSDCNQIKQLIDAAVNTFGKIDILVNNAGVGITRSSFDVSEEEWRYISDIDERGVFFTAQAAAKVMAEQKSGSIVNIASLGGVISSAKLVPYMAAKAAVIHMTKGMAVEWAKYNVRVNAVAPGYVRTPLTEETLNDERNYKILTGLTPMRRLGLPEEIANVVLFLASDAASYITGETVIVDGGRHAL